MHTNEEKSTNNLPQTPEQLFDLEPQQQRFIQMYMTGQYSMAKIAQLINIHPNTASRWMKQENVQTAIRESQDAIHQQVGVELKSLTVKATRKLHELIDSPIDAVALQAVKDVLDRGGHKAKQEIKVDKTVTTIEEKLSNLIESTVIDVDYEEVSE